MSAASNFEPTRMYRPMKIGTIDLTIVAYVALAFQPVRLVRTSSIAKNRTNATTP